MNIDTVEYVLLSSNVIISFVSMVILFPRKTFPNLPEYINRDDIILDKLPYSVMDKIISLSAKEFKVLGYDRVRGKKVISLSYDGITPLFFIDKSSIKNIHN